MIRRLTAVVIVGWLGVVGVAQAAGDAAAAKAKAAVCAGCHGEKGEGVAPNPKLAGIPEADLLKALKDFKSGAKSNPMMNGIAATLSEQDMENFAAYYASFK
jgi:cytochrome c553